MSEFPNVNSHDLTELLKKLSKQKQVNRLRVHFSSLNDLEEDGKLEGDILIKTSNYQFTRFRENDRITIIEGLD